MNVSQTKKGHVPGTTYSKENDRRDQPFSGKYILPTLNTLMTRLVGNERDLDTNAAPC